MTSKSYPPEFWTANATWIFFGTGSGELWNTWQSFERRRSQQLGWGTLVGASLAAAQTCLEWERFRQHWHTKNMAFWKMQQWEPLMEIAPELLLSLDATGINKSFWITNENFRRQCCGSVGSLWRWLMSLFYECDIRPFSGVGGRYFTTILQPQPHTVDGRNPAPVDMVIPLFIGFQHHPFGGETSPDFWTINSSYIRIIIINHCFCIPINQPV